MKRRLLSTLMALALALTLIPTAAMAADECIRAVLFLIRWQSGVWQQKRLLDAAGGNA